MASKHKPVYLIIKLQALDEVDKKVKVKTQIAKVKGVLCSTLSTWLKNKDALRKAHRNLFAKLSIYHQSLLDMQPIFHVKS